MTEPDVDVYRPGVDRRHLPDPPAPPAPPAPRSPLLTVPEVVAILRVSAMTVYRQCNSGELPCVKVGRSFRIPRQAVRDLLGDACPDDV
jgi:excisionase family DNA binding protein